MRLVRMLRRLWELVNPASLHHQRRRAAQRPRVLDEWRRELDENARRDR